MSSVYLVSSNQFVLLLSLLKISCVLDYNDLWERTF